MNFKMIYLLIGIVLIMGLLPQRNVSADMGPKPTMEFELKLEGMEPDVIVSIKLMECGSSPACENEYLFEERFPSDVRQYFGSCDLNGCSFSYYDFDEYHRLAIQLSNGTTFKSNVFENSYFDSRYKVLIRPDSLYVEETRGSNLQIVQTIIEVIYELVVYEISIPVLFGTSILLVIVVLVYARNFKDGKELPIRRIAGVFLFWPLIIALTIFGLILNAFTFLSTLLIEFVLAYIYLRYLKLPAWDIILRGVLLANIVTQPLFILVLTVGLPLYMTSLPGVLLLEIFVCLVEAIIIFFVQGKQLSLKRILLFAFLLNAASFGIGLLLPI